jgi:uncharacterized protein (DUF362 family)
MRQRAVGLGPVDRRGFLRGSVGLLAGAGLFSAACGDESTETPVRPRVDGPDVAVVRQRDYDQAAVKAALARAFSLIGGVDALVRSATVTVKVNLTGYATAAFGRPPGESYTTHPATALALASLLSDLGAARVRFVESCPSLAAFEGFASGFGWDGPAFAALGKVSFENTRNLGGGTGYVRREVPGTPRLFSYFMLNHSYAETDVMISLAKMKNHVTAGVTLAIKNMFGITPNSLYGTEAGTQGEGAVGYRLCLHDRAQGGVPSIPGELPGFEGQDAYFRIPRILTDVAAARRIDLAIIDGITAMSGGEGPWCQSATNPLSFVSPGVLVAGRDAVATDAIGVRLMGYANPLVSRGTAPFAFCDNHIQLAHTAGLGIGDPARINVLGETIADVATRFAWI